MVGGSIPTIPFIFTVKFATIGRLYVGIPTSPPPCYFFLNLAEEVVRWWFHTPTTPLSLFYLNGRLAVRLCDRIPTASLYFIVISALPSAVRSWVRSPRLAFSFCIIFSPFARSGRSWFESHSSHLIVYLINFFPLKQELGSNPPGPIFFFICLTKLVAKGFESP